MRGLEFNSWSGALSTLIGVALVALITIGIRLLVMLTIQARRDRMNRQINERLKTLIAAYKTLGGSFTGNLAVDPAHLRDKLRREANDVTAEEISAGPIPAVTTANAGDANAPNSDRVRRIRDAVEGALSDIILLGTEEHVRLAQRAARDLVAGHHVYTDELVVALRDFIRKALDIGPIPDDLEIPAQGPARPSSSGARNRTGNDRSSSRGGGGATMGGAGLGAGGIGGMGVIAPDGHDDP